MNLTLHITDHCNMDCNYCYQSRSPRNMDIDTALAAVDLSVRSKGDFLIPSGCMHTGVCFFGGEPLLRKDLIEAVIDHAEAIHAESGHDLKFLLVTNGTLMDDDFLAYAKKHHVRIGLSHDGLMQDPVRKMADGLPTFQALESRVDALLKILPDSTAMLTIHPDFAGRFSDSVKWLFNRGFRKINTVPAVGDKVTWSDDALRVLEEEYSKLSDWYVEIVSMGCDFSLPLFDMKIRSHIAGGMGINQTCRFGQKQLSVAPDGQIYPCIQFLDLDAYLMGNVFSGIAPEKVAEVMRLGAKEPEDCQSCALRLRCKYNCCCQNMISTGASDQISGLTCAFEKMAIRYADQAANELAKTQDSNFIRRFYGSVLDSENEPMLVV